MARDDQRPAWTNSERETVKQMLRDDFTCAGIGRIFRPPMTRVGVLKRVVADPELWACRPGLHLPNLFRYTARKAKSLTEKPRRLVEPLKQPRKTHLSPDPALIQHKAELEDPPLPPMRELPVANMRNVPLVQLGRDECRWPVADAPEVVGKVLFCGKATKEGKSYCKAHTSLAVPFGAAAKRAALDKPPRNRLLDKFGGVP